MNMNNRQMVKGLKKDNMTEYQRGNERSKNLKGLERQLMSKLEKNNNTLTLTQMKMYRQALNSLNMKAEKMDNNTYKVS